MKISETFYISSLMYLQSFWLRNMHLKMTFFHTFCPVHEKTAWLQLRQDRMKRKRKRRWRHEMYISILCC